MTSRQDWLAIAKLKNVFQSMKPFHQGDAKILKIII